MILPSITLLITCTFANRFNTSVREQIYQPLVYNRLNIRGVPRIFLPYEELQFFGINYGGESPRSY